jgi:diaminohydroxyphosphoribosylaminopyrimidine deaminase/5-amino-6-(5-phosphoribosylamino)uracil reductase
VLWECGPALAAAALKEGCVQEVVAVIAPKVLGGEPARTPLGCLGAERMADVAQLATEDVGWLEGDFRWRLALEGPWSP